MGGFRLAWNLSNMPKSIDHTSPDEWEILLGDIHGQSAASALPHYGWVWLKKTLRDQILALNTHELLHQA